MNNLTMSQKKKIKYLVDLCKQVDYPHSALCYYLTFDFFQDVKQYKEYILFMVLMAI